jgi:hypothetical protein
VGGQRELPLRITLVGPPPDVAFAVQRGRDGLLPPSRASGGEISFDVAVRVTTRPDGSPSFLGDFAQGTPADRFIYVNSGRQAGEADSCWDRRAKVKLGGITPALVDRVLAEPGAVLEARIRGRSGDGGPICASTPLLNGGWTLLVASGAAIG